MKLLTEKEIENLSAKKLAEYNAKLSKAPESIAVHVQGLTQFAPALGKVWISDDEPISEFSIQSDDPKIISDTYGENTVHHMIGTEAMGDLKGYKIPFVGTLPEEPTALRFYGSTASRDWTPNAGGYGAPITEGDQRVVMQIPA